MYTVNKYVQNAKICNKRMRQKMTDIEQAIKPFVWYDSEGRIVQVALEAAVNRI